MASTRITLSLFSTKHLYTSVSPPPTRFPATPEIRPVKRKSSRYDTVAGIFGAGLALTVVGPASAAGLPLLGQLSEPTNALSFPTWAIHVSSVVEWITAMLWCGNMGRNQDLNLGRDSHGVPLLGGAFCACTWHLFYNSESLEVLVALQAALTVIGNATMCIAAFRIYKSSSEERPKNL